MDQTNSELELAWMELSFWRDFAKWRAAERSNPDEPRILEAIENAERRYAKALRLRQI